MSFANDILELNLDLTFDASEDKVFFESNINSKLVENNYIFQKTFNYLSKQKIRKMKVNSHQNINFLDGEIEKKLQHTVTHHSLNLNQSYKMQILEVDANQKSKTSNQTQISNSNDINDVEKKQKKLPNQTQSLKIDPIYQQQYFGSIADEITNLSKVQYQRMTKLKKYNTNLHGFNRIGARQLFIRSVVEVNPKFNIQYIYNTGIGTHSENENVISKIIQNTAKNMFGPEFKLENSTSNQGLLEYKQNSNIYSSKPTQEQLKALIFGDFDSNQLL